MATIKIRVVWLQTYLKLNVLKKSKAFKKIKSKCTTGLLKILKSPPQLFTELIQIFHQKSNQVFKKNFLISFKQVFKKFKDNNGFINFGYLSMNLKMLILNTMVDSLTLNCLTFVTNFFIFLNSSSSSSSFIFIFHLFLADGQHIWYSFFHVDNVFVFSNQCCLVITFLHFISLFIKICCLKVLTIN